MLRLTTHSFWRVAFVLMLYLLFAAALAVNAADIRVEGGCTLREAIGAANRNKERGGCAAGAGDDVIILTRDSQPGRGQLPRITSKIVLRGGNHKLTVQKEDVVFRVEDGELTVYSLNVDYAKTRKRHVFEVENGRLTLVDVTVENCTGGVRQNSSYTTIRGQSDICGLPADHDQLVTGTHSAHIDLPLPTPVQTCATLPGNTATVTATYGLASGVQCQQVNGAGIGIQSVIDAGFIDAIDVWGHVDQGVELCFPQLGSIIFLDAATSPRTVTSIESYSSGDRACATLDRPGTLVLVPGQPTTTLRPTPVTRASATVTAVVDGCPIRTTGHLKLRAAPSLDGEIIGYVTRGSSLGAISRTTYWFQVNYLGQTGWIGGKYVANAGDC